MKEFDNGGQFDGATSVRVTSRSIAMAQQQQSGTNPLATAAQQIAGDFGNGLEGSGALARKFLLDLDEVFANQFKNFSGRK